MEIVQAINILPNHRIYDILVLDSELEELFEVGVRVHRHGRGQFGDEGRNLVVRHLFKQHLLFD